MSLIGPSFIQAVDDIYTLAGESAVFTPLSGDQVDCLVLLDKEIDQMPVVFESGGMDYRITVEVRNAEIGKRPESGEVFTVDEIDYTVDAIIDGESDDIVTKCSVRSSE